MCAVCDRALIHDRFFPVSCYQSLLLQLFIVTSFPLITYGVTQSETSTVLAFSEK